MSNTEDQDVSGIEMGTLDKRNRFQVNKVSTGERNNGTAKNSGSVERVQRMSQVGKSSFRDTDKPSRFKDVHAATRFQVCMIGT